MSHVCDECDPPTAAHHQEVAAAKLEAIAEAIRKGIVKSFLLQWSGGSAPIEGETTQDVAQMFGAADELAEDEAEAVEVLFDAAN